MSIKTILIFILFIFFSSAVLAENGYVQARQAELFAEPSFKESVIAVAHKGDAVVIEQRQGRWLKVKFGDKEGWVSKLLVSGEQPKDKITVLDEDGESLDQTVRRRASATTEAAAARGLRGEKRDRREDKTVNFDALHKMEQEDVSEDDALQFQQEANEQ